MEGKVYGKPLSYPHIPLIIFSSDTNIIILKVLKEYGCQMDIFPTVMRLLNFSYINNTLGVDLLNDKWLYSYFPASDKIGCIDKNILHLSDE
jgi:hypothetical protein